MGVLRRRDGLPSKRRARRLPEYLDKAEIDGLIRVAPHPQAALLILMQWRAGLRVSEALALEPGDLSLDTDRPTLRVRRGKGNKTRIVPVHPELGAALMMATTYGGKRPGPFVAVDRSTAWRWVQAATSKAKAAGLMQADRHIGTHTLRHSAARHWLASGIAINAVSRWLGHSSLQTTLIYLEILPDPSGDMARVP